MKRIVGYLKDYALFIDRPLFFISAAFTALLIFINYRYGLNDWINQHNFPKEFTGWFLVFIITFSFAYVLNKRRKAFFSQVKFNCLLIIAAAIFAWKMSYQPYFTFSADEDINAYWNHIAYWPFKLLVIAGLLFVTWKFFDKEQRYYGWNVKGVDWKPYWLMLLVMIPLIAAAATRPDFMAVYPKLQNMPLPSAFAGQGLYQFLFELSYGSDFIGIELFFRGFLILAFVKWAGKDAILPMAMFYCTIHFGKPLGECISSFFGGLLLGVVTYHTRSIFGGLIVHLGIAWLMELAGWLAHQSS